MSKPETEMKQDIIKNLNRLCDTRGFRRQITPIESNLTQQGIPDIYGIIEGVSFWIECKWQDYDMNPLQCSWREAHTHAGGKCFLVIGTDDRILEDQSNKSYRLCYQGGMIAFSDIGPMLSRLMGSLAL